MRHVGRTTLILGFLALIAGAVVLRLRSGGDASPRDVARLAAAIGEHRLTLARLAGPYTYVPCRPRTPNDSVVSGLLCRDTPPDQWAEAPALRKVASDLRTGHAAKLVNGTHAAGLWRMLWQSIDAAIETLESASERRPRDAALQNDLGVAMLMRAEQDQDPRWILRAFTAVDSAARLDPTLPAARYNRALILDLVGLIPNAIAEWKAFLDLDRTSPWAAEGRARLEALETPLPTWAASRATMERASGAPNDTVVERIAALFPRRVSYEVQRLTLNWAQRYLDGDARADSVLPDARILARALATAVRDSLWLDAVDELSRAGQQRNRTRLNAAARGLMALDSGQRSIERLDTESIRSAETWLLEANRSFIDAHSAFQYLAVYGLSRVPFIRVESSQALAAAKHVLDVTPSRYPRVRGLAAQNEGVIQAGIANFRAAIDASMVAVEEGKDTRDPVLDLGPRTNMALNYAGLGFDRLAWRHLYHALRSARTYPDVDADVRFVFIVAARLSQRETPAIASLFRRESVRYARLATITRADSLRLIGTLERHAELLGRVGSFDLARETVREAREILAALGADSVTASFASDIDLVDGLVWSARNSDSAMTILSKVATRYRATQYRAELDRALLLLANAQAAAGAIDSARQSFDAALAEMERRSTSMEPDDRQRFLEVARPVIDQTVAFLADRGDTVDALTYVEHMRSRVLLEHLNGSSREGTSADLIASVRSSLPKGTSIISYAVLPREMIAWRIDRNTVSMHRLTGVEELDRLSSRFLTLIQSRSPGPELHAVSSRLNRLLLAPFARELSATTRLIIVPDKWLHFVPFSALFDDSTKTFAIERFDMGIAPSIQLYAQSLARYQSLSSSAVRSVLAVGDPAFDTRTFALPPLPGARAEAEAVARLYPNVSLLTGPQATKAALLAGAAKANVVHFAGHGVLRPDAPRASYLLLASAGANETTAVLTAGDLFDIKFDKTRLVVLSGCETANGQVSDTEGPSSLARAWFGAGVPAVVASLWAVDDVATAQFFSIYHQRLSSGVDPTVALRQTQQEWLGRSTDRWQQVATWAAFAMYGATVNAVSGGPAS